jgi:hypothetical protein
MWELTSWPDFLLTGIGGDRGAEYSSKQQTTEQAGLTLWPHFFLAARGLEGEVGTSKKRIRELELGTEEWNQLKVDHLVFRVYLCSQRHYIKRQCNTM